jgi:hypothetical protein
LVRSEAKKRANKQNGRKGGLVKRPQERLLPRQAQRLMATARTPQEKVSAAVASIAPALDNTLSVAATA